MHYLGTYNILRNECLYCTLMEKGVNIRRLLFLRQAIVVTRMIFNHNLPDTTNIAVIDFLEFRRNLEEMFFRCYTHSDSCSGNQQCYYIVLPVSKMLEKHAFKKLKLHNPKKVLTCLRTPDSILSFVNDLRTTNNEKRYSRNSDTSVFSILLSISNVFACLRSLFI